MKTELRTDITIAQLCEGFHYSELEGKELNTKIKTYMEKSGLQFQQLEQYLSLYPDKIFRNMYKVGVLNGISA